MGLSQSIVKMLANGKLCFPNLQNLKLHVRSLFFLPPLLDGFFETSLIDLHGQHLSESNYVTPQFNAKRKAAASTLGVLSELSKLRNVHIASSAIPLEVLFYYLFRLFSLYFFMVFVMTISIW